MPRAAGTAPALSEPLRVTSSVQSAPTHRRLARARQNITCNSRLHEFKQEQTRGEGSSTEYQRQTNENGKGKDRL